MQKMRGIIDPYTLGILFSLVIATTAHIVTSKEPAQSTNSKLLSHYMAANSATCEIPREDLQ